MVYFNRGYSWYISANMDLKNLFRKSPPPTRLTAKDLDFAFKDDHHSYHRINTQLGVGLEHYGKAMDFTMWMAAGLHPKELDMILDVMERSVENIVEGKKGNLAILGWGINEMRLRRFMVIHTELLYNFIACHYIRDDEPPTEWIESIHNEKVEAFKLFVKTRGVNDFFQLPELRNLTPTSSMSPEELKNKWQESIREQENLIKKVKYLRSGLRSAPERKTSTKAS